MRILVLGATGLLGYEVFRICLKRKIDVHGIVRNGAILNAKFGNAINGRLHEINDVRNINQIEQIFLSVKPDYVINCIGIVKQSHLAENYIESIWINSLLPHQLEYLSKKCNSRLIHISTDCVFNGKKGLYKETDKANACDLYGKSKYLGEVAYGNGLTIRTSIIGHELVQNTHGLLEWFLSQEGVVNGFEKAIFSGLTTFELTKVMLDVIIPQNISSGLYQVSSNPITKYDLLRIIAEVYQRQIDIVPSKDLVIDRSLDGRIFVSLTGYQVPSWRSMIEEMNLDFKSGF